MANGPLAQVNAQPVQPSQTAQAAEVGQRTASLPQETVDYSALMQTSMERFKQEQERLNMAVDKMISSLDRRRQMPFDPNLMRIAAAFAKPTKTGSFGESLGYAAEEAVKGAEDEFQREQLEAKLGLELQQKKAELARRQMGMETLQRFMPGAATTLSTGPGIATAPAAPGAPAPAVPGRMPQIPVEFAAMQEYIDPETGKVLSSILKGQQTERELVAKETTPVEIDMEIIGPKKVLPNVAREYQAVLAEVARTGNEDLLLEFYMRQGFAKRPARAAPGAPAGKIERPETVGEKKAREEGEVTTAKTRAEEAEKKASLLITRGQEAFNTREIARDLSSYATSNPRAFQLMQNADVKDSILRAVEQGLQAGQFGSFSVPVRVIQQYKLSDTDIEALQMFMARQAELTTQFRKSARAPGEGATTESEGRLFAQLGVLPTDSAKVIRLKSEFLERRADFDEEVARAWVEYSEKPGNSYNKFLMSPELKEIKSKYEAVFKQMREANADLLRSAPKSAKPAGEKPLVDRLREAKEKKGVQ